MARSFFAQANCIACHTPRHLTDVSHPVRPLREQTIYPYTDLLLHDMGEGLSDGGTRRGWLLAASGARRRCGASGWWTR